MVLQNATKCYKKKKEFKYMSYHYRAIELRYRGEKYESISLILSTEFKKEFKNQRIRRWFNNGGILDAMYLDYAVKENDRRRKVVMEELKKITGEIPTGYANLIEALKNDLTDPKSASVFRQTLKDLSELLGFKVDDNIGDGDPLKDYFNKAEEELEKEDKINGESKKVK